VQQAESRRQQAEENMATVEVKNLEGQTVKQLELADAVFAVKPNQSLLWEATKQFLASQRRGTHKTKNRAEVSGGGKKPWRQKGTGRARVGSIRSSLWRHGSIAHGPVPRDYSYELPKKMLRGALRSALAAKFLEKRLTVVDQFELKDAKTKNFAAVLRILGAGKTVLVVDDHSNRNLDLSSRNIAGCDLLRHHKVHPYHVLSHDGLVISEGALTRLQESLR
jgi:large subunit ribosomal protein L4